MFNVFEVHPDRKLTLDQAAATLGVSRSQLTKFYRAGLRSNGFSQRRYIRAGDLVEFIARTGHDAAPEETRQAAPVETKQGVLF